MEHFVSQSCKGVSCRICGAPATHKVGEEIMHDDPMPSRHNFTAYVCCQHFVDIFGEVGHEALSIVPTLSFQLDSDQQTKLAQWQAEHDKTCPKAAMERMTAIGGRLTYSFIITSLGAISKLVCLCGQECDVTDYDNW